VTVTAPPPAVTVTITPADVPMPSNSTFRFTAQVRGASDTSVRWSVLEGDAGGTIDATGFYISPLTSGEYHVVATSNADPSAAATALVRTDTQLVDRGGPVQPAATVYAIWWGSQTVFADAPTELAKMFSGLEGTAYLRTLDQYMRGTKATVSFAGNLFDASAPPAGPMSNAALETEICGLLDANGIAPRQDGVYAVFSDNAPPQTECQHGFATCHGMTITIAYIPNAFAGVTDPQSPDVCGRSQMVGVFSLCATHELFEAMTDPTGRGWWDFQAQQNGTPEIADKCGQIPIFTCSVALANGSMWRLPYMWSNAANQCVLATP